MPRVEIYTSPFCGFCSRAKALLDSKGVEYEEFDVMMNDPKRREMQERSQRTSVPQIFINGTHIGGCSDLQSLDREGALDPLLKAS